MASNQYNALLLRSEFCQSFWNQAVHSGMVWHLPLVRVRHSVIPDSQFQALLDSQNEPFVWQRKPLKRQVMQDAWVSLGSSAAGPKPDAKLFIRLLLTPLWISWTGHNTCWFRNSFEMSKWSFMKARHKVMISRSPILILYFWCSTDLSQYYRTACRRLGSCDSYPKRPFWRQALDELAMR